MAYGRWSMRSERKESVAIGRLFPVPELTPLLFEELEGMRPLITEQTWDAPQHTERFDGSGCLDSAHIFNRNLD